MLDLAKGLNNYIKAGAIKNICKPSNLEIDCKPPRVKNSHLAVLKPNEL